MPGMPYHLEKGAWGAVFEDFINGGDTAERALRVLCRLRGSSSQVDGTPGAGTGDDVGLTDLDYFRSPALDNGRDERYGSIDLRRRHFAIDWLGRKPVRRGRALRSQPEWCDAMRGAFPAGPDRELWSDLVDNVHRPMEAPNTPDRSANAPGALDLSERARRTADLVADPKAQKLFASIDHYPETGFWHQYYGDVEGILRETIASAIEVALGIPWGEGAKLDPDDLLGGPRPRCRLPIEVFWKCPQRWWEGWITWRTSKSAGSNTREYASGQVTVILATPGSGTPLLERPGFGRDALRATGPEAPQGVPASYTAPVGDEGLPSSKGMWVVTHEDHLSLPPPNTWVGRKRGDIVAPPFGPYFVGSGGVVVIEPSEGAGGTRREGRAYVEPPKEVAV